MCKPILGQVKAGLKVEEVVHLFTADAADIKIAKNSIDVKRTQLNTTDDYTLETYSDILTILEQHWMIPGVNTFGRVMWNSSLNHSEGSDVDSHFDTKTYGKTFDWVRDLQNSNPQYIKYNSRLGANMFYIKYNTSIQNTRFVSTFINGRFLINNGVYSKGRSDKFVGPPNEGPIYDDGVYDENDQNIPNNAG